ncbi:proto-oncogene tyrosine-protein kinase ROS [Pimephales promelas]|uniref:proto-oncogene tyrosine-protein kinase ROS n=1 Tax=Pimephales promelas TaxID=90988 RepID=UPI0019558B52|nr:proto-oncogene tyrosine-protein kinase ROS [Pimephales promelas]XP_039528151.1 proto-oncogene tyrosine-protein kinase ROS [Pimephales promelas]
MEEICGERKEIAGLKFVSALFLLICLRASSCDEWLLDASVQPMTARSGFKQCTDAICQNVVCPLAAPYSTWIGSHNITMSWESLNQSDVVHILQWTGPSLSGIWEQAENVTESTYTVKHLEPFTYYKFRLWAMIAEIHVCSPASPWYQTKPFGLPSSPSIESIESVSGQSVEVRWSLPEKPGGPILGFNLNLTSNEHVISVATGGNVFFNTFYPTIHNTTYRISVAAVNEEGQGSVAEGSITTPAQVEQNGGRWVFVSRWNSLRMREEDADFFTAALCLSDGLIQSNITGVAVHYSSNHVYFSEGTRIWSKGAGNLTDHLDLKLLHSAPMEVTALTVDWLYHRIYYVSSGRVYYCGLDDCSFPVDLNLNLSSDIVNIIADPYNGWLFLLLSSGIYRCPLPDAGSGQQHEISHIVKTHSVSNFVVSFPNKRLVYHDKSDQTLNATSMDGLFPITLYKNINFEANSIVYDDDFFMLTNGYALYKQVGQTQVATFNEFTMDCDVIQNQNDGFGNLCDFSTSAQPYPVPRKPRHLQVLFGSDKANVYWDKPENMIGASPSAWQNWTYAINCSMNGLVVMRFSVKTSTHVTVPDLQSSQQYSFTVRACSPSGCSRSVSYEGTTLQPADELPYIAAACDDEIWRQDLESIELMEPIASYIGDVKDMDWYSSTIYWTNSSGHINWIELVNQSLSVFTMPSPMNAEALAFDWLGQYLYWSCNSNQICRGSPTSGHGVEIFHQAEQKILSLVIDSLNAAIYWTTETSVEGCRLDGEDYKLLDKLSVFSGKEVAGITLNVIEGNLYWLVQDGSLLNLYRVNISPLRMQSKVEEFARWTTSQISNHQVGSYSGRLVWLDEKKQLRIQELNQNNSVLMSSSKTLTAFSVVQQMLKPLPDGFVSSPLVIPPAVSKIILEGNDTFFQIHWEPSSVDYGTVIYCVVSKGLWKNVEQLQNKYPTRYCHPVNTFSEAVINVTRFKPGAKFNITITPFSYWGRGESTQTTFITPGTSLDTDVTIILIVSVAAGFTLIILIVAAVIWYRRHKKKDHGTVIQTGLHIHPDVELEYIRGLVGLGNACFAISAIPAQEEIEALPVFPRECLKLQRLLGSGAFGEVYEGVTVGNQITGVLPDRRVAVKTLRKDASDYEKAEFLKEAHLMSQFNHPNILRLLGVCLLNEPHYLILELMEGGDLQSYLRGARPTNTHKGLLNLTSLLDISLDAATGCAYLERKHFVHRDIAARNCLVSVRSYTDPGRVVKIGDFGLARDVYKNDYYRKKGEGLLPVRWMSPESLTDGIFNKYSDVWAFGVLLWEIMTLGMLPYPTYTNHEVLSFICTGERLPLPAGCTQRLYNLMMSCWSKEPTERPNFQYLEETLSKLRDYEEDKRANQNGAEGHMNQAYQEDEEEVCTGVDEDEVLETGLSPVLSNEGLNYLMYQAESPDSVQTDTSTPTEDR